MQSKNFRTDINGLRAIAVIAVVFFHFNKNIVPGGFAGVDVFFVISGYLMTSIITTRLNENKFQLLDFYMSRVNRIIPPLLFMIFIVMVFGWFFLSALDYRSLSKHAASSMLFLSNYVYFLESGYFESSSYEKWLLHTWSLSVEWQFYIIYPIIITMLIKAFGFSKTKKILLLLTVIVFFYSIHQTRANPNLSYFNFPSRAWEMLIGGVAFLFKPNLNYIQRKALLILGCLSILCSIVFFNEKTPWPSAYTLIPTIGTYLVIIANLNDVAIFKLKSVQIIGKTSYSIYLWHWPIVVFGYFFGISNWLFVGVPLSFIIGLLSYKFIESKKYFFPSKYLQLAKSKVLFLSFFSIATYSFVFFNNGMDVEYRKLGSNSRYDYMNKFSRDNYLNDTIRKEYMDECNFYDDKLKQAKPTIASNCTSKINNDGVLLWGDSHAQALSHGLRNILPNNMPFSQIATSACKPSSKVNTLNDEFAKACNLSNTKAIEVAIEQNPKFIIFAQQNEHDKTDYESIIKTLRKNNVTSKFILIGPVPQWNPSLPRAIALRHPDREELEFNDISFDKSLIDTDKNIRYFNTSDDLQVISILEKLCQDSVCIAKVDNNNTPLVWDYGHLTLEGSLFIANNVLKKHLNL